MKRKSLFTAGLIAATIAGGVAFAHGPGGSGDGWSGGPGMMGGMMGGMGPGGAPGGMMGGQGGMGDMMQMMTRMHGPMMGGGMAGPMGPEMMGGLFQDAFDADGDGRVGAEELRSGLTARLAEHDADGDGTLSLAEFEALHSALIRNLTVDHFQAFDEDGDGKVTGAEIAAPADRLGRMEQMQKQFAPGQAPQPGQMPMMDQGTAPAATDGN